MALDFGVMAFPQLVDCCSDWTSDGWGELDRRITPTLRRIARFWLGCSGIRDADRADVIGTEAFAGLLRSRSGPLRAYATSRRAQGLPLDQKSLIAFLARQIRNRVRSEVDRDWTRRRHEHNAAQPDAQLTTPPVMTQDWSVAVGFLLRRLPASLRATFQETYLRDGSVEVSAGLSRAAFKKRCRRLIQFARTQMTQGLLGA